MIPNLGKHNIQTWLKVMKKSLGKVMTFRKKKVKKGSRFYKTNTLVLSKKYASLKTRGLKKVPYSKSSFSRLIFCNQQIKYSMFLVSLWAIINTKERTLTTSLCITVVELTPLSFISWCFLENQPITLCLTDFYFHRTVCKQKTIWRNLTVGQYFRALLKMGPKPGKTSVIVK